MNLVLAQHALDEDESLQCLPDQKGVFHLTGMEWIVWLVAGNLVQDQSVH